MFGIAKRVDAGAPVKEVGIRKTPFTVLSESPKTIFLNTSVIPENLTSSTVQKTRAADEQLKQRVELAKEMAKYLSSIQESSVELNDLNADFQKETMDRAVQIAKTDSKHVKAVAHYNHKVGGIREETKAAIAPFDDNYNKALAGIGF